MAQIFIWFILIAGLCSLHLVFADETCRVAEKPKLQIVFVNCFSLNRRQNSNWVYFQTETTKHLIDMIKKEFPDSEFSLVGFLDYPDTAILKPRAIDNPEYCYIFRKEFTKDRDAIVSSMRENLGNGNNYEDETEDSVTTAMLFAAVDKRLKWNKGFYDSDGKLVRKIMIPSVFRGITKTLKTPEKRTVPKADGTDTCATALPPTIEQLSDVLYNNHIAVVNTVLNIRDNFGNGNQLTESYYEKEFAYLYGPYYQLPFPAPGTEGKDQIYNYEAYAKLVFQKIKKEVMECDWEDPVGYNSLGL